MSVEFETLGPLPNDRSETPTYGRLLFIFAGVFVIHIILLANLSFDFDSHEKYTTLRVKLQALEKPQPTPFDHQVSEQKTTETIMPIEQVPAANKVQADIQITDSAREPANKQEKQKQIVEKTLIQAWLPRAKALVHERAFSTPPTYKTFSTDDFPTNAGKPGKNDDAKFYRGPSIQTYVRQRSKSVVQGNDGMLIIKSDDGFGNVRCFQERGTVSTFEQTNPTLWYPVPLSTCGHIK